MASRGEKKRKFSFDALNISQFIAVIDAFITNNLINAKIQIPKGVEPKFH